MSLNNQIQDPLSGHKANVTSKDGYYGLQVFTQEYKDYLNKSIFFSNPVYGVNMNRDFSTVVATQNVHDGGDNTYGTATIILGQPSDFDFTSTDYAHTGTQSINCTSAETGDQFQLANDTLISSGDYDQLVGGVYITANWDINDDGARIILYNTTTNTQVSSKIIYLNDYVNSGDTQVGQKFTIPIVNFGVLSDDYDSIRGTIYGESSPPDFYLDDIALLDVGGSDTGLFNVQPPYGAWGHLQGLGIMIASNYSPVLADSTMPKIPYNGFLGVPLSNGITYQRSENGQIQFSFVAHDLIDILGQYNANINSYGSDGTYTGIKIDMSFRTPFLLKSEYNDFISFQLNDDLSSLEHFRVVADIKEEARSKVGTEYDFQENSKY